MHCSCLKCGYNWESKKDDPKRCPDCKSVRWKTPKFGKNKITTTTTTTTTQRLRREAIDELHRVVVQLRHDTLREIQRLRADLWRAHRVTEHE